jgi:hypothetical protein
MSFGKRQCKELHIYDKDEDQRFIQAWFRAQYAETIRPGKAGSKNEDFEKIGTRFHSWFRDNLDKVGIEQDDSPSLFRRLSIKTSSSFSMPTNMF